MPTTMLWLLTPFYSRVMSNKKDSMKRKHEPIQKQKTVWSQSSLYLSSCLSHILSPSLSLSLSLFLDELGAGGQSAKIEDEFFQPPSRVARISPLPPIVDSFSFYHASCLCFRNSAFNVDYVLIYFGNLHREDKKGRGGGCASGFLLERSIKPFCILLPRTATDFPSLRSRVYAIYHSLCLSSFSISFPHLLSPLQSFYPPSPLLFPSFSSSMNVSWLLLLTWSLLFAQALSKLLPEWLLRLGCRLPLRGNWHAVLLLARHSAIYCSNTAGKLPPWKSGYISAVINLDILTRRIFSKFSSTGYYRESS